MNTPFPQSGDVLDGRFRVDTQLASGGYSRVYKGFDLQQQAPVAIKLLVPPNHEFEADQQRYQHIAVERFRREAVMITQLQSPFTIRLLGFGETPKGLLYMALEYIDGFNLHEALMHFGPFPADRAVVILTQLLHSLHEAHKAGMIHRDIKPANILLYARDGVRDCVKLLDFGIARASQQQSAEAYNLTQSGTMVGTPRYMAPEQMRSVTSKLSPGSDLYSLGHVMYELLVGVPAIERTPAFDVIRLQLSPDNFRLPDTLDVPDTLRFVVNRLLEKDPAHRFASAKDVLAALGNPAVVVPVAALAPPPVVEIPPPALPPAPAASRRGTDEAFANRVLALLAGMLVIVIAALIGYAISEYRKSPTPPVTSSVVDP